MYKYEVEMKQRAQAKGFDKVKDMLVEEYKGRSLAGMAEVYGMSKSGIRKAMLRYGVKMGPRGGPNRV